MQPIKRRLSGLCSDHDVLGSYSGPEVPLWESEPIGTAGIDLATRLFVKIGVEQFSEAFSVQPVSGTSPSAVQPTK